MITSKVIQEYTFHESSTRGSRPKFFEMIKFIEKQKEPVALICDKVDRLQRSFKEAPILEKLRQSGKLEIHLMTEQQVLHQNSTSQELMLYNIFVVMAQNYTDSLSYNIRRSHIEMIKQGRVFTKLRVGYKRDEKNSKEILIDESCAFLIKRLFVEYATGLYSVDELHEKATEWGLKNKKTGKPFDRSNIGKILMDEFYIGIEVINKGTKKEIRYPHIYPHLISDELFERCRKVREGKGRNHSNKIKDNRHGLFKGMIKCKNCGCTVTPEPPKKGKYIYLRPKPKNGCNCKQINEEVANKLVEDTLKDMTIPEDILKMYLDKLKQRFDTQHQEETQQQKLKAKDLEITKKRLDRLVDVYLDNSIDKETYDRKKAELTREVSLLENQIANFNNNS
ncbi:recombinase family protein, partial [bacterium]|nr:recombinase family protein [bacterium]